MFDMIIRNGNVVDGTGAKRRVADVGIAGDRITAVGAIDTRAEREIDATGHIVAPGFIDVHTHYDAQLFWDGAATPSPLHGVTTVIAGNCGFSIAPLSDRLDDNTYLMRMLARVEGVPLEALEEGVAWQWRSTAEYLDALEGTLGVNAGFMVGHSALRRTVLGADANARHATAEESAAMVKLLHDGLEAGAFGFSSSWARTHNDGDGKMVPSRCADDRELVALAGAVREHPGTSLEFLPMVGPGWEPWAIDLMAEMSVAAQRPLNWNVLTVTAGMEDEITRKLEASDVARARGGRVIALTFPHSAGLRLSFGSGFVFDAVPGWEEIMLLPRHEKIPYFTDPTSRERLNLLAQSPDNPMRMFTNWATKRIYDVVADENRQYQGRLVGEIAAEQGRPTWDVLCDIALADELLTSFGTEPRPETDADWNTRIGVWRDGRAVIGASDAGAHLDMLAGFNYPSVLLSGPVRERGLIELEEVVHYITDVPARMYGLVDRGKVDVGNFADIVVFDPDTISSEPARMRYDLPGGAGRLYAESVGIEHVLVNGRPIVDGGRLTASRPGTVLRSGRDSRTPDLEGVAT